MSVTHDESGNTPAPAPPPPEAADHPNPGGEIGHAPGPREPEPAPLPKQQQPSLSENSSHASALPDAAPAHAQAGAAHAAVDASADPNANTNANAGATTSANPFLDTESTPALPPRPEPEPAAEHTMAIVTAGAQEPTAHADAHPGAQEPQVSPQVASLRAMFPDFDVAVLQSVLDSVNGDQERALDILLGMSDPEYVSTQTAHPQAEPTSLDLDEQLARQLMLEDQQHQQRHATGDSWPRRDQANVPYQARQAPDGQRPPPPEGSAGRTDLQEFQRTMGQIAESGKRTFSSLVSKVKAKINEYEATRNAGQSSSTSSTTPQWGTAPPTQLDRHTASQAYQPQIYGAHQPSPSPQPEPPISLHDGPAPAAAQGQVQGYSLDDPPAPRSVAAPVPVPAAAPAPTTPPAGARFSPAASPRPSGDVPRPPPTGSGSPVNAAKIGLLPKRPVSLLNASSPPATRPRDDDDDLEYVENPFEERK